MSVWSWIKLTVCLWLLRKMIKAGGWLLLVALAVAAWPVTMVAAIGYGAAWLRGWPPARLRRTAAWALLPAGIWLAIRAARLDAWRPVALTPVHEWERGWSHLAATNLTRAFVLLAPFAVPAGLALAALAWAWRIYALTTGLGGIMATAADHLRRPPVEEAGPHRPRPDRGARRGAAAGRGAGGSRSAAPSVPSVTAGTRCSPSRPPRARGTWSSSARPAAGRPT